jgi:hypothetical protein
VQTAHTATVAAVNNWQFNVPFVWHPSPNSQFVDTRIHAP